MAASDVADTGLLLGKFYPPTLGHTYLVDFARHYVRDLTVVVGTLKRETIPGKLRFQWMKELFPGVRIVHIDEDLPQCPEEHPEFWTIWRDVLRRFVPTDPDCVFASESYGFPLAEILGARFIPVDIAREIVPVSASAVRDQPFEYWQYLPACVRPYFVKRVAMVGPESTGKTTLARDLAHHFQTVWAPEYARGYIDAHEGTITREMFPLFVRGQRASIAALARQANRLLICDSDLHATALFHELYFDCRAEDLLEAARADSYDLYLVMDCDVPHVQDGSRFHPHKREWFVEQCVEWAKDRGTPYVLIQGSWDERLSLAKKRVADLLHSPRESPPDGLRVGD